jgi:hypothetical protein
MSSNALSSDKSAVKLHAGMKIRATVNSDKSNACFKYPVTGTLEITEVSVDNQIITANILPDGADGFGGLHWPVWELAPDLAKFTLYWKDGKREVIEGEGIGDAATRAGYGGGAFSALDCWATGDCADRVWVAEEKCWKSKRVQEAIARDQELAKK